MAAGGGGANVSIERCSPNGCERRFVKRLVVSTVSTTGDHWIYVAECLTNILNLKFMPHCRRNISKVYACVQVMYK